jgi:adenylate kinase
VRTPIFDLFPGHGVSAKTKVIFLGTPDLSLLSEFRSLNLEHVSPTELMRSEISRSSHRLAGTDPALAAMRRWFFTRKPDAGFVLTDFPATLLQAIMFDEWLDARGESLQGVVAGGNTSPEIVEHYRTLGLFIERPELTAA